MLNQLKPLIQQQSKSKRGRKAKAKPVRVSRKLELDYTRVLLAIVDDMHTEAVKALMPLIEQPSVGDSKRIVNDGLFSDFKSAFSQLSLAIKNKVSGIASALVEVIVGKQAAEIDKQLIDLIQKQTGLGLSGLVADDAVKEAIDVAKEANIALINSIPQQYLDRLEQAVTNAIQLGASSPLDEIDAAMDDILRITKNRAKLIASDQLGKITVAISRAKQAALGITHYTWVTMRDRSVRGNPKATYRSFYSHYKRDNKVFAWSNPPPDGHPSFPINCRCLAIPYVGHLTGGLTGEEMMAQQPPMSELI